MAQIIDFYQYVISPRYFFSTPLGVKYYTINSSYELISIIPTGQKMAQIIDFYQYVISARYFLVLRQELNIGRI